MSNNFAEFFPELHYSLPSASAIGHAAKVAKYPDVSNLTSDKKCGTKNVIFRVIVIHTDSWSV